LDPAAEDRRVSESGLQLLKEFRLIPVLFGLVHAIVVPWFGYSIMLSILERPLMVVKKH
jgi:hypothetical protein